MSLRLRTKLLAGFLLLVSMVVGTSLALYLGVARDGEMTAHQQFSAEQLVDALELRRHADRFLLLSAFAGDNPKYAEPAREALRVVREAINRGEATLRSDLEMASAEGEADELERFTKLHAAIVAEDLDRVRSMVEDIVEDELDEAVLAELGATHTARTMKLVSVVVPIMALGAAAGLLFWILRPTLRRIAELDDAARSIARGRFTCVASEGADELATLGASFNLMAEELRRRTRELERRNADLTSMMAALEQAQDRLADASRKSGMADVASGILHNVGNVLNSLNVSVELVSEGLRGLKFDNLQKSVAMLEARRGDLTVFVSDDPRGRNLIPYLSSLAQNFVAAAERLTEEIAGIRGNVDHIKSIVTSQQAYAKSGGLAEPCSLAQVANEALGMVEPFFRQARIEVIRDLEAPDEVVLDRHKTLQVLVNLLRNAGHAVEEHEADDRRVTLRTRRGAQDTLEIQVEDNGVGILPENLPRIFGHGFTTRLEGHGFGLHSSANAAQEMKGALRGHSEGADRGALFTLTLPSEAGAAASAHAHRPLMLTSPKTSLELSA